MGLEQELRNEVGKREKQVKIFGKRLFREKRYHVLVDYDCAAIGNACTCDDVLFEVYNRERPDHRFAVVHLTWQAETDPRWPSVRFFEDFEAFKTLQMLPDAADYED